MVFSLLILDDGNDTGVQSDIRIEASHRDVIATLSQVLFKNPKMFELFNAALTVVKEVQAKDANAPKN
jgi:hypothetical protein